jgi:hypothetical protein
MRKNHNSLKSDRKRKTLRDTSLSCDTNKFESMKERLCLKCGEKLLGECPYNHICEKCSLINEKIALKTFSVSSKPFGEEDPLSRSPSFSVMQGSRSTDS